VVRPGIARQIRRDIDLLMKASPGWPKILEGEHAGT
jgi:hypothetical protein